MDKKKTFSTINTILWSLATLPLLLYLYRANSVIPFLYDDNWYMTNLVTEEPCRGISDVIESQIWHFYHWGGRNITHSVLQFVLMGGLTLADILNVSCLVLLTFLTGKISKYSTNFYLPAFCLIISCCPDLPGTLFWQAGVVNYLYSLCWILPFSILFIRAIDTANYKVPIGISFFMIPLALMSGWSNENLGPMCFVLSLFCTIFYAKKNHKRPPVWMIEGSLFSLLGAGLVILAPGNFVRNSLVSYDSFGEMIVERIKMMASATFISLGIPVLLLIISLLLYLFLPNKDKEKEGKNVVRKINLTQGILLGMVFVSHFAFFLSPTYPERAMFGALVFMITTSLSFLSAICKEGKIPVKVSIFILSGLLYLYTLYILIMSYWHPAFSL